MLTHALDSISCHFAGRAAESSDDALLHGSRYTAGRAAENGDDAPLTRFMFMSTVFARSHHFTGESETDYAPSRHVARSVLAVFTTSFCH